MATSTATNRVYTQVIEDVINNVRNDFLYNGGPGHAVLLHLQGLWEAKMMQAGGGVITHGYDLNVPYEEYETPTTDLLFPPTPMQTPLPVSGETPLPGIAELYNIPTGGTPFTPAENLSENSGVSDVKPGRPCQFMQPPAPWLNQNPSLDVNVAYDESREEVGIGASHQPITQFHVTQNDVFKDDDEGSDYEPLNENDDDLDDVGQEEDLDTQDLVLAQFDKVVHPNGRWKCTLKDGIMHINNKDILFNKANGQFDFNKNPAEQLTKRSTNFCGNETVGWPVVHQR